MSEYRDLHATWTVLSTSPPASGISIASAGYSVEAGPVVIGVDAEQYRHLLIPLLPGEAARTDSSGDALRLGRVTHGGVNYMTVACLRPALYTEFTRFARELSAAIEDSPSPARTAGETFDRWRNLFTEALTPRTFSTEALIGLLGELMTVERILELTASPDLGFWTGPRGSQHDFRTAAHALEVKATLVREGRVISISSGDQLDSTDYVDLSLIHIRFERDPAGTNLSESVARVLDAGASTNKLADLMLEVGIGISGVSEYDEDRFRVVETRCYDVKAPGFPRITRNSFYGDQIPPGTLRLRYSIDLTNEPPSPMSAEAEEAILAAIAEESRNEMDS